MACGPSRATRTRQSSFASRRSKSARPSRSAQERSMNVSYRPASSANNAPSNVTRRSTSSAAAGPIVSEVGTGIVEGYAARRAETEAVVGIGSPLSDAAHEPSGASERGDPIPTVRGGAVARSARNTSRSRRQRRQRWRVERLMRSGATAKVPGPVLSTLPART